VDPASADPWMLELLRVGQLGPVTNWDLLLKSNAAASHFHYTVKFGKSNRQKILKEHLYLYVYV